MFILDSIVYIFTMPNIKQQEHLTKDGEPDHRYKENRDDEDQQSNNNGREQHLKKDGEPDRRHKENEDQQSDNNGHEHLRKDGEPDHRYKENRDDANDHHQQQQDSHKKADRGLFSILSSSKHPLILF